MPLLEQGKLYPECSRFADRATRDQALEALRTYLHSNRAFTALELRKLWRGLFFCMWHSDRPRTQQRLARALAELVAPVPAPLFAPFLHAFWATMAAQYPLTDGLRLDKFLYLMRCYANAAFAYLDAVGWPEGLLAEYLSIIEDIWLEEQGRVSDGLRYHVLELWVDELEKVDEEGKFPLEDIMAPIERLAKEGRTKALRDRAKECLADERLKDWGARAATEDGAAMGKTETGANGDAEEDEWRGLEDD